MGDFRLKSLTPYLLLCVAVAFALRTTFIVTANLPFESDEAIVGLMARHILYQGDRPIFYYGQNYLGPLEPASAAFLFWIMGPKLTALRLAPTIYSVIFLAFSGSFASRAFGIEAGLATLIYLACPPLFLLIWSVKARGGYAELLALGAALLWLTREITDGKSRPRWAWLGLGLIGGLAAWTDPLAIVYLVPIALFLLLRLRRRLLRPEPMMAVGAFTLACGPMLAANVRSGWLTLRELANPNVSAGISVATYRHNVAKIVTESLPTIFGFYQASSNLAAFGDAQAHGLWPALLVTVVTALVTLAMAILFVASLWRAVRGPPAAEDLVIWVGAMTLLLFCSSQTEILYVTEPRYLLPLYALVPIAARYWAQVWRFSRRIGVTSLALVIALNVSSVALMRPALDAPYLDGQVVNAGDPSLVAFLDAHQIRAFYADYWLTYPVAFQSQERIVPSVIDDHLHVGFNRYIPYAIVVVQASSPAVLVVAHSPTERQLENQLRSNGSVYQIAHWQNLDLFEQISPSFHPNQL